MMLQQERAEPISSSTNNPNDCDTKNPNDTSAIELTPATRLQQAGKRSTKTGASASQDPQGSCRCALTGSIDIPLQQDQREFSMSMQGSSHSLKRGSRKKSNVLKMMEIGERIAALEGDLVLTSGRHYLTQSGKSVVPRRHQKNRL